MPPMSATEQEAIAAGTVWWEAELFRGDPGWAGLLTVPAPKLSAEERAFLDGPVETLCAMLDDWRISHELHDLPPEVWRFLKQQGFFGIIIPKSYGGLGFSALAHSETIQKIASRSVAAAVTVMVPNSLGPAELLLAYGTEEQKRHYLPRLATGAEIPCFALTGPEAGSDAAAIPDTGVVCRRPFEGRETLGLLLNWDKRYITLGPVATLIGLAFHAYDPDHLLGEAEDLGITLVLLPAATPGIDIGNRHDPLDIAFLNGPTRGRGVFIPLDRIIGGAKMLGQGWRMLMERLSAGRGISLPALSAAAGKLASDTSGAYARVRHQFRISIGRFEGVQEPLARIGALTYLMDAGRLLTISALEQGEKPPVVTAIVKHYLTEIMRQVVNDAMDIHGGRGICLGPANYLGRTYQSLPVAITVEGANILTRSLILFGQGAMRCHPYLAEEIAAASLDDPGEGLDRFDRALAAHLGYILRNASRAFIYGLSGNLLAPSPVKGETARYFRQLNRFSAAFAITADLALLLLGGALKRMESISGRFADALGYLYLCSAVLKRFEDDGRPPEDLPLVRWAAEYALYRVQEALDGIARNFPHRLAALKIRAWALPLGRRLRPPSDALGREVAGLLLEPSASRERLVRGIYRNRDSRDPTGILHQAMELVLRAADLEKSLRAKGYGRPPLEDHTVWLARLVREKKLTEPEALLLRDSRKATLRAIRVDEFGPDEWLSRRNANSGNTI
jgi:acyl-CoA dehydrogenase